MVKSSDSLFKKLQSTLILIVVLVILLGITFVVYKIYVSVMEGVNNAMSNRNIKVSKSSASIGVNSKTQESVVDSAQRYVYKAWENSRPPEDAEISRWIKLKEWKDRKRTVFSGSGTEAANSGWFN